MSRPVWSLPLLLAFLALWLNDDGVQAFQQSLLGMRSRSRTRDGLRPHGSRAITELHATLSPQGGKNNDQQQKQQQPYPMGKAQIQEQVVKEENRRNYVWLFPPTVTTAAFAAYADTSRLFHKALDWGSGHTWVPVDGGKYIAEITKSALTGPVTFSVSILFGSLVGLTISTLNARQQNLRKLFVLLHQEGQELQQLMQQCSDEQVRADVLDQLMRFMHRIDQTMRVPDKSTADALRQSGELQAMTEIIHVHGTRVANDFVLGEIYGSLGRLKNCRVELWSAYTNNFSVAHYTNMVVLASALLLIFLLETDNGAMQFLIEFQLSICWALLLGAYSLLAAVILDLRGIPPQLTLRLDQDAVMVKSQRKRDPVMVKSQRKK